MKLQPYSKRELAMAYAPNLSESAALNRLAHWIRLNPALTAALSATGYRPRQQLFTIRQVSLIFEHLGEP